MKHKKYISTAIDHPDPTSTPWGSYKNTQQTLWMRENSYVMINKRLKCFFCGFLKDIK